MKTCSLKLWATLILLFSLLLPEMKAQEVFTLDLKTNTVKRSRVETDPNFIQIENQVSQDSINKDYLSKSNNKRFNIKRLRFNNVFRRPLKVGDYLTFQVLNVKDNFAIDSIATTYNFFDRNVQEYASIFKNIVNSRLEEFNIDNSNSKPKETSKNESKLDNKNPDDNITKAYLKGLSTEEEHGAESLQGQTEKTALALEEEKAYYRLLFDLTAKKSQELESSQQASDALRQEVYNTINSELQIISDFDAFYAVSPDIVRSDSMNRELILSGLLDKFEQADRKATVIAETNRIFKTNFTEAEIETLCQATLKPLKDKAQEILDKKNEIKNSGQAGSARVDSNHVLYAPLQILNQDITYFYLQGFKNGKKVYERPYVFLNRGGFKVDFSAGFIGTTLRDDKFFLKPTKDTTFFEMDGMATDSITSIDDMNIIRVLDDGKFQIGISIMGHFYSRIGKRINLAISPGFYLNTDSNINYLVGVSALLGLEQRFILNAGCAFGKVKTLNPVYDEGQLIPTSITTLPEIDKWKSGFFVGISYNL